MNNPKTTHKQQKSFLTSLKSVALEVTVLTAITALCAAVMAYFAHG